MKHLAFLSSYQEVSVQFINVYPYYVSGAIRSGPIARLLHNQ